MTYIRRVTLALLCMCASIAVTAPVSEAVRADNTPGFAAHEIKAAFLLHLFQFITWPEGKVAPAELCFVGEGEVSRAAAALLAKRQSRIEARQLGDSSDFSGCSLLFIDNLNATVSDLVLDAALASSVLVVSDQPGFAAQGGMVELERQPARIGLIVNLPVLEAAGLKPSSKLLRLATVLGSSAGF